MHIVGSNNKMSDGISRRAGSWCPVISLLCVLIRCRWERGCCNRYIVGDNSSKSISTLVYHHRLLHASYIFTNYKMMMINIPINIRRIIDSI